MLDPEEVVGKLENIFDKMTDEERIAYLKSFGFEVEKLPRSQQNKEHD